jgi:hypothetical protein
MIFEKTLKQSAYARCGGDGRLLDEKRGCCAINNTSGGEPALWPCEPIASCDSSGASVSIQP